MVSKGQDRPSEADKLIFQNANNYRLHADNLRWTLLGGYAVFFAAVLGIDKADAAGVPLLGPTITGLFAFFSLCYLWILAVQNWFYNLFAKWVAACEEALREGEDLPTLKDFSAHAGPQVNPFHPAFIMAEVVVGLSFVHFLWLTIERYSPHCVHSPWIWVGIAVAVFGGLNYVFRNWNACIYKPIILRISNLYQPVIHLPTSTSAVHGTTGLDDVGSAQMSGRQDSPGGPPEKRL